MEAWIAMTAPECIMASVHVLGSVSGYCTLGCSANISAADREALEVLGFGQTDDSQYIAAMKHSAVGFGRPLPSGRYGVTRVLPGRPDSAGRQTLLFVTLVFEGSDWERQVSHSAWALLNHQPYWLAGPSTEPIPPLSVHGVPPQGANAHRRDLQLRALSAWEAARACGGVAVLGDSPESRDAVGGLAGLLPPSIRVTMRWGVGVLSLGAPVDVCTLPSAGESSVRRRIIRAESTEVPQNGYCAALAHFWAPGQALPRSFIDSMTAMRGDTSVESHTLSSPDPAKRIAHRRTPRAWVGCIAVALLLVAAAMVTWYVVPVLKRGAQNSGSDAPITSDSSGTSRPPVPSRDQAGTDKAPDEERRLVKGMLDRRRCRLVDAKRWLRDAEMYTGQNAMPTASRLQEEVAAVRAMCKSALEIEEWGKAVNGFLDGQTKDMGGVLTRNIESLQQQIQLAGWNAIDEKDIAPTIAVVAARIQAARFEAAQTVRDDVRALMRNGAELSRRWSRPIGARRDGAISIPLSTRLVGSEAAGSDSHTGPVALAGRVDALTGGLICASTALSRCNKLLVLQIESSKQRQSRRLQPRPLVGPPIPEKVQGEPAPAAELSELRRTYDELLSLQELRRVAPNRPHCTLDVLERWHQVSQRSQMKGLEDRRLKDEINREILVQANLHLQQVKAEWHRFTTEAAALGEDNRSARWSEIQQRAKRVAGLLKEGNAVSDEFLRKINEWKSPGYRVPK